MRQPALSTVLAVLLLCVASSAVVTGSGAAADGASLTIRHSTAPQVAGTETVALDQRVERLPDRPGVYEAHHEYRIPDSVRLLEVSLPSRAAITSQRGFVQQADGRYAWDGTTARPTLTYRVAANETTDRTGPIAAPGDYLFVDTGAWGLVRLPEASHRWGSTGGKVGLTTETSVNGPGAASDRIAFLGAHERYTHTAHGQQFTLIVPANATPSAPPAEIFASLDHAAETLRVGDRDERVFLVAAPTGEVRWGVRGLQTGPADMWVRDSEPLNSAENVWLHEYVHTRQGFSTASDAQWFTEGSADYYAALLTLEQERIDFEQFRRTLSIGQASAFEGVVLSDPATWRNNANYYLGALVAGELDRRLRVATNGQQTLQAVWWQLNTASGPTTAAMFRTAVQETGGSDVAGVSDTYTRGTERPSMWTAEQHSAAFGAEPARITYELAEGESARITGPYRNRSVRPGDGIVLVPGERLTLTANVTNFGGTSGGYEAVLDIDGQRRAIQTGTLDAGESATVTFEAAPSQIGPSVWTVGGSQLSVSTREAATAAITGIEPNRTTVAPGEAVALTVAFANDAAYPGGRTVSIAGTERTVSLDANATGRVTVEQRFDAPGTYSLTLDGASATITVRESRPNGPDRSRRAALLGIVALVLLGGVLLLAKRR